MVEHNQGACVKHGELRDSGAGEYWHETQGCCHWGKPRWLLEILHSRETMVLPGTHTDCQHLSCHFYCCQHLMLAPNAWRHQRVKQWLQALITSQEFSTSPCS